MRTVMLFLVPLYGWATIAFSQPAVSRDTTAHRKKSYQVKTVKTRVIRMEPSRSKDTSLPVMRTRKDTLLYLIERHKRQSSQPQR